MYTVKTTTRRELGDDFKVSLAKWLSDGGELVTFNVEGSNITAVFKGKEKPALPVSHK